ncbi:MAG: DinB family protein [Bacteroidota bacterium]|nr:DinB family protein [Bacteroidota bacterium]MDP4234646.1 DinB family protein [Bacteroidota bacterium]MDP4243811.1 DinB family protein [Bacteroidota bacterium]MDP4288598.1 DinB family protein [Bacteroidota bacterium]
MTRKIELLTAYDAAWDREWESLQSVLKHLTEEEARYQHPAYSEEPLEDGHPPAGTVLWYIVHLPHCYRHYADIIRQRPNKPEDPHPPESNSVEEALANLQHDRTELRNTIATLSEEELDEKLYYGGTVPDLVRGTVRHDAWHAGQIAVARRLYRMRGRHG